MKIEAILAAAFGLCLIAAGPAIADGGGSDRSDSTTCGKGEVWDSSNKRCVKAENGVLPDKALTDYAYALVRAGRYREAIDVLNLLKDPNTAVALDPHYAQVREYLGEAYLLKGDTAGAQAQLRAIKGICGTVCESYEHLAVAIADPADI